MIELDRISAHRGLERVLQDVSLSVRPGRVLALLGPNGAGKSTCLAVAAGDLPPSAGQARLDGRALRTFAPEALARRRAVLPQSSALDFELSVEEVVVLGRSTRRGGVAKAEDFDVAQDCLRRVDLSGFGHRSYLSLSGGERQRVHLARVLAQLEGVDDPALLLDEPTSSLDVAHAHHVLQIAVDSARAGAAVLVVLHDLWLASRYADDVVLLSKGRIAAQGPTEEVLAPERVGPVYGVRMSRLLVDGVHPLLVPSGPLEAERRTP